MQHDDPGASELPSPQRRLLLKATAGLALGGALFGTGWLVLKRGQNLFEVHRERTLMQTSVAVTCLTDDLDAARGAIGAAFGRMAASAAILTRFDSASALSRLNRDGHLARPPAELRDVLQHALALSARPEGALDISVLPVLRYVGALRPPVALTPRERDDMGRREHLIGYRSMALDVDGVRLLRPGMAITLDGIAKGYVVDQGIAALRAAGIEYAIVDAGGDTRTICGNDPNWHWNVGIVDPQDVSRVAAVVQVRNAALSTSGNYRVYFSSDRRLFHIVDPRTGYSPQAYSSVTVVAERSVLADGLSTGAFSMGLPQLTALAQAQDQQWLVFSRTGEARWRSRDLPLVAGKAEAI
jgi:thiamine biosynthesis lipoprotein